MKEFLPVLAILLLFARQGFGQELFTDFPTGSLKSWSLNGTTFQLEGDPTWAQEPNSFRWVYFRAEGMTGLEPTFQIGSPQNSFFGDLRDHRFVWSYDQEDWSFFDNNSGGSLGFRFSNETPFSEDAVYVAYSPPYPLSRTERQVEELRTEWFVQPTASATTDLLVEEIEGLPLYGFQITNPLITSPKRTFVLVGGNHSGEMGANFALEGTIDFLTSDDPRARQMRNEANFIVYPQVDPLGRVEGYYRGNSQDPTSDHNRFWNATVSGNNGGFAEIDLLVPIMKTDAGEAVDMAIDYHGFWNSQANFVYTDSPGSETEFIRELLSLEPTMELDVDDSVEPAGIFEFWAKTPEGLNADYAFTPEFSPNLSDDELLRIGENYALALFAELGSPEFSRSHEEIDALRIALAASATNLDFDLNRDGVLDEADREFLLGDIMNVLPGDADIDGNVGFADFLRLAQNFSNEGGWGDGDFDGNGFVQFQDFLALAQNFGENASTLVTIPEPSGLRLAQLLTVALFCKSRRNRLT